MPEPLRCTLRAVAADFPCFPHLPTALGEAFPVQFGKRTHVLYWVHPRIVFMLPSPDVGAERGYQVAKFDIDGHTVHAPGFTLEQFMRFVDRAREAQLRTSPGTTPGTVFVLSGSRDARYRVTRYACACAGHRTHGRCWHHAYAVWLVDVAGVDVTRIPTIGVSRRGLPLTTGRRIAS